MNQTKLKMKRVKTFIISAFSLAFISLNVSAQKSVDESFKPNGKPVATIFSDFRYNSQDGKSNTAFELTRAYFGYVYNFSPNFTSKVLFDVSNSSTQTPSAFTAYLKNAFVEYNNSGIKLNFGMIGTNAFSLQESLWGKRYLLKSFQDLNGFSSSADLGVGAKFQLAKGLNVDAQLLNGEGYQKVQADSTFKIAAGITYEPIEHLYLRVYGDYMKKNVSQKTFNAFIAYAANDFTIAGEYNIQKGNKMVSNHNLTGISIWGTYHVSKASSIFARYDNLSSNTPSGSTAKWNKTDGDLYTAGVELFPVKGVSIAPNIQYTNPKLSGSKSTTSLLVNVGLNF
jgi:hypothetical protein